MSKTTFHKPWQHTAGSSQRKEKAKYLKNPKNQDKQLVAPTPAGPWATSFPIYTLIRVECLRWLNGYRFPASLRTIAMRLSSRVLRLHLGSIFGTVPSRVEDGADWKKRCRDGGRNSSHCACWQWAIAEDCCRQDGKNQPWPGPGQDWTASTSRPDLDILGTETRPKL